MRDAVLLTELSVTEAEYDGGLDRSEVEAVGGGTGQSYHTHTHTHTHTRRSVIQWLTSGDLE